MSSPAPSPPPLLAALFPPGTESVSLAEFMAAALYHPEHGYYTRRIRAVGRRGDFSTGPAVSDLWGRALARWAARQRPAGWGRPRHLIEVGGGGGDLALALLQALGSWGRRGLVYHLVEISEPLRFLQEKRLKGLPVRWHATIESALAEAEGRAAIFSNELVDAFPCEQYVRRGGEWRQVRLRLREGRLHECEAPAPATALPPSSALDPLRPAAEGARVEVQAAYRAWLEGWRGLWKEGAMATIDYGDLVEGLYHRRPRGTLRGYAYHQLVEGTDLYLSPGQRDLTADVNFTDLQAWGEALGFQNEPLATQAEFLRRWAPPRALESADPAVRYLLAEEGMGGAFRVLEQRPG